MLHFKNFSQVNANKLQSLFFSIKEIETRFEKGVTLKINRFILVHKKILINL